MLLELTFCKTVYRKRGEALGTRLRKKCTIVSSLGTREEKIRRGRKVSTKIKCQPEPLFRLKTNAATIFYSLDCVVFVNCRYIIVMIISSPHHHNHHHHIIIITNVNIIIILLWCNNRRKSSKLPSMKEQTRNLENGPLATTIFCILDRVFSVGILSDYANSGKYVFTIIL